MAPANPRASTNRLAVAACALGMLTYLGIKELVAAAQAPASRPAVSSVEPALPPGR